MMVFMFRREKFRTKIKGSGTDIINSLEIWQMSFSERFVCLRAMKSPQPPVISDAFSPMAGEQSFIDIYNSSTSNPAQLYACRESRAQALKEYRPFFGACILFSPGRDIAYF
ncbi:hypothetical protein PG996_014503 [Apiospora saccharicola]|uniref:2EXR domain-containing protein n=1 Tax=Apiospora saccharicola TaxID=335842 RepID=A0ABR1TII0_9PEZI